MIEGVTHNVPFLRDVVRNRDFAEGKYSTAFIGQHYPDGWVNARFRSATALQPLYSSTLSATLKIRFSLTILLKLNRRNSSFV